MNRFLAFALGLSLASPALAFSGRIINLGDATISAAVTDLAITSGVNAQSTAIAYVDRLEGMNAASIQANFAYSAGGTSLKVDVETSLDQGSTWLPICRFAFTTASAEKVMTVSGLTPRLAAATPATLSDDTCLDGTLGDRLRSRVTSVGTYTGATIISVRASVR